MSRAIRTGLCIAVACLVAAGPAWSFGFSVQPARVAVSVPAGKRRGKTLTVKNARPSEAVHLTIYVRDVRYATDGSNEFVDPGTTPWSCAGWVQVSPSELDIPANATRDVRVSVTAPPDATGGHYAVVFFETSPSYDEGGIGVNFRIGAVVEAVVPGTQRHDMRITNAAFQPPDTVAVTLFNEGNLLIRPKGALKIFDAAGRKVHQQHFNRPAVGVLPKTERQLIQKIEAPLAPGRYRVSAEVDYGARTLIVGELPVDIR